MRHPRSSSWHLTSQDRQDLWKSPSVHPKIAGMYGCSTPKIYGEWLGVAKFMKNHSVVTCRSQVRQPSQIGREWWGTAPPRPGGSGKVPWMFFGTPQKKETEGRFEESRSQKTSHCRFPQLCGTSAPSAAQVTRPSRARGRRRPASAQAPSKAPKLQLWPPLSSMIFQLRFDYQRVAP